MNEAELRHFVESTLNYFASATGEAAKLGLPYIKNQQEDIYAEYTGIIGISGERKGAIYVTSDRALLEELAKSVTSSETEITNKMVIDMVGELANTISGNVTKIFGRNFHISVPILLEGKPKSVSFGISQPVYVIPAEWRGHKFFLVIGIAN